MARCRRVLLLILATCGLSGCSAISRNTDIVRSDAQQNRERASRLTAEGVRHLRRGHLAQAEAAFQHALSVDGTHGPAHNNLGLLYFEKRDLYSAAWSFERAMEFMPDRSEPTNNLGLTYETAGRLGEAVAMYYSAHQLEPQNFEYLGNLTRARIRRGDRDDVLRQELQQLVFIDVRPEWIDWAENQLVLLLDKPPQRSNWSPNGNSAGDATESLPTPLGSRLSITDEPNGVGIKPPFEQAAPSGEMMLPRPPQ